MKTKKRKKVPRAYVYLECYEYEVEKPPAQQLATGSSSLCTNQFFSVLLRCLVHEEAGFASSAPSPVSIKKMGDTEVKNRKVGRKKASAKTKEIIDPAVDPRDEVSTT